MRKSIGSNKTLSKDDKPNVWANFGYNIVYQILIILIPIITTPYITRVLGADGIGEYSYAYAIANYFVLIEMLGVNNYGNRSIAKARDDKLLLSKTFLEIYSIQIVAAIAAILLYLSYCIFISDNYIMSLIMIIFVISGALDINWFFYGLEKFKITVTRNIIIKLATTILLFLIVKTHDDVYKYALIYVIGILASQIVLWFHVHNYISFVKIQPKDIIRHIKPNLILFIPVIAISLYKIMDKIMLGILTTKIEVGFYESCDKLVQIPLSIVTALGIAMLPRISNLVANNDEDSSNRYMEMSIHIAILFSAPLTLGIIAVSPELVPIFFGAGFEKCIDVFNYLMPSCIFLAFANVIRTQYLIPHEMDKVYITSVFSGAALNLIINYLLIPSLGSVGAAIGTLCAEEIVCIIQSLAVSKFVPIRKYFSASIPYIIFAVIMLVIIRLLDFNALNSIIALALKILLGGVIYGSLLCLYYIIFKRELWDEMASRIRSKAR